MGVARLLTIQDKDLNMLRWTFSLVLLAVGGFANAADSWPQWRGLDQNGVVEGGDFPVQWSNDRGIEWQVELPGRGGSTPVHANGMIFVTSGVEGVNHLMAISAADGSVAWDVELGPERVSKHGKNHRKGSGSNPSVVIDGDRLFAYYRSGDLACVTTAGAKQWHLNLQDKYGEDTLWWNLGTTPILTDNEVVVAVMQTGASYLVGLNKETGSESWKVDRMLGAPEEAAQSYTTPLRMEVDGRPILAVLGADHLTLHDAESGKELARLGGFNPDGQRYFRSIASPVATGNTIVCPYARGATITTVDAKRLLAGEGSDAILWFRDDLGADVPTPAAKDGKVYVLRDKEGVVCVDAQTGEDLWTVELPRSRNGFTASPLVTEKHLYATREDGTTFVIELQTAKLVQTNEAGQGNVFTVASVVPIENDLLLRTPEQLIRITGQ